MPHIITESSGDRQEIFPEMVAGYWQNGRISGELHQPGSRFSGKHGVYAGGLCINYPFQSLTCPTSEKRYLAGIQCCCQLLEIHLLSRFRLDRGTLQVVSLLIESVNLFLILRII